MKRLFWALPVTGVILVSAPLLISLGFGLAYMCLGCDVSGSAADPCVKFGVPFGALTAPMSLPAALTIGAGLLAVWAVWAIVRIALYFKSRELTIGRAYAISYLLLLPLLLCLLLELAGGFTDGSDKTPEYLVVLAIAPLANLQLGFVTWIWMKVYGTRAEHPRQWLRVISHFLYTLPFLIPLARLGLFVGTALMTKPGHRDSNGLLFLVAANIAFWLWRKKLRSARPIAR